MIKGVENGNFEDGLKALFSQRKEGEEWLNHGLQGREGLLSGKVCSCFPFAQNSNCRRFEPDARKSFPSLSWLCIIRGFKFLNLSREISLKTLRIFETPFTCECDRGLPRWFLFSSRMFVTSLLLNSQHIQPSNRDKILKKGKIFS